jgi:oligopeptidase A
MLDMPCYITVIPDADNRVLREKIYKVYISRASEIRMINNKFDNATVMGEILNKRQEKAVLPWLL